MKVKGWQISFTVVSIILGLLIAVQLRNLAGRNRTIIPRPEFYARLYQETDDQRRELRRERDLLLEQLRRAQEGKGLAAGLTQELEKTRILAGLQEVEGPGLIITLDSSEIQVPPGANPEFYAIQDEDLLGLVNDLLAAGAEAIAINEQRRVAWTEIRRAGVAMSVNNTTIGEPYVIKAIGEPASLEGMLKIRGGVLDSLRAWGIHVNIMRTERVVIPPYRGNTQFKYARPR